MTLRECTVISRVQSSPFQANKLNFLASSQLFAMAKIHNYWYSPVDYFLSALERNTHTYSFSAARESSKWDECSKLNGNFVLLFEIDNCSSNNKWEQSTALLCNAETTTRSLRLPPKLALQRFPFLKFDYFAGKIVFCKCHKLIKKIFAYSVCMRRER